jgi:hypothetical protein
MSWSQANQHVVPVISLEMEELDLETFLLTRVPLWYPYEQFTQALVQAATFPLVFPCRVAVVGFIWYMDPNVCGWRMTWEEGM